jgi:predicted ATPase
MHCQLADLVQYVQWINPCGATVGSQMLKKLRLLRERVQDWDSYPFFVPCIRNLDELILHERICFFAGENGTGKSTLLEAIAAHYGFGREGGNRNFANDSTESNHSIDPLVRALRLSFDRRTGSGYFLRAESWFNTVSHMDELDKEPYAHSRQSARIIVGAVFIPAPMARRSSHCWSSNSGAMGYFCWTSRKRRSRLSGSCPCSS